MLIYFVDDYLFFIEVYDFIFDFDFMKIEGIVNIFCYFFFFVYCF